ncbi:MAG: M18 family aminopeptidase [Myxococcales bacterium]|nr:M18 family aminopeptidase [Myxococcales bacterium]
MSAAHEEPAIPEAWTDPATRRAATASARALLELVDRSPTPWHAAHTVARRLEAAGFSVLREENAWTLAPGDRRYVLRDGSTIVAFVVGSRSPALAGFRIIGAHTDSPNLRVKPQPSQSNKGYRQFGVDVYGGVLLSTWLDRDLSLAGRVLCVGSAAEAGGGRVAGIESVLVDFAHPVARVPNLAIHLNRKVNDEGLILNKQRHMVPVVGLGDAIDLEAELARVTGRERGSIVGFELCLYDVQKGALGGLDGELVLAARLDNLASCFAATEALCATPPGLGPTAVIALYDHEECGSHSAVGAASNLLEQVLGRIASGHPEVERDAVARAIARSLLVSSDMAHAVHPNYADRHDDEHAPWLHRGMVVKTNVNQSYATTGATAAAFQRLCRELDHKTQSFVVRSDLPCGSTIGPITATRLGLRTVDVGAPMLSMHSCREMCGVLDVWNNVRVFAQLFQEAPLGWS